MRKIGSYLVFVQGFVNAIAMNEKDIQTAIMNVIRKNQKPSIMQGVVITDSPECSNAAN